jgi:hypothetical protein
MSQAIEQALPSITTGPGLISVLQLLHSKDSKPALLTSLAHCIRTNLCMQRFRFVLVSWSAAGCQKNGVKPAPAATAVLLLSSNPVTGHQT